MISKINAIKRAIWFVTQSFLFFSEETHSCLTPCFGSGKSSNKGKIAHLISLILSVSSVCDSGSETTFINKWNGYHITKAEFTSYKAFKVAEKFFVPSVLLPSTIGFPLFMEVMDGIRGGGWWTFPFQTVTPESLRGLGEGGRDSNNPFHSEISKRGHWVWGGWS